MTIRASLTILASILLTFLAAPPAQAQGPVVYAGDGVIVHSVRLDGSHARNRCSINSLHPRGGFTYAVTAGHCLDGVDGRAYRVTALDGTVLAADLNAAPRWEVPNRVPFRIPGGYDSGMFRLDAGVVAVTDRVRSAGHPSAAHAPAGSVDPGAGARVSPPVPFDPRPLPLTEVRLGEQICKDGDTTARTCGIVLHVNPAFGEVYSTMASWMGDSGGAGYVWRDGVARNVGIVSGTLVGGLSTVLTAPDRAVAAIPV